MGEVIKISEEQLEELRYEDSCEELNLVLEESGKWVGEGKYEYRHDVFKRTTDGKLFELSQSRSGNSDYHYEDVDELYEVRKVPITTYKYEAV